MIKSLRSAQAEAGQPPGLSIENPMLTSVAYKVRRLQHAVFAELREILRRFDLRPVDFASLRIVAASKGISQVKLAAMLGVDPPAMVLTIDRLEVRNLVERVPDKHDRRKKGLVLGPKGSALLDEALLGAQSQEDRWRALLGDAQWSALNLAMDELLAAYGVV